MACAAASLGLGALRDQLAMVYEALGQLLAGAAIGVAEGKNAAGHCGLDRGAGGCQIARHDARRHDAVIEHRNQHGFERAGVAWRRQLAERQQQKGFGERYLTHQLAEAVAAYHHRIVVAVGERCSPPAFGLP